MSRTLEIGRLCNQIFRNVIVSIIAEKHDLQVKYVNKNTIESLGISLYSGKNNFEECIRIYDENYFDVLNYKQLTTNIDANHAYFQSQPISDFLFQYLRSSPCKENIQSVNIYNDRYQNNNDLFLHIRLGDVAERTPGIDYFLQCIERIVHDNLYIASDDLNHPMIQQIKSKYPDVNLVRETEVKTIQFGSTCKHIVLSHGTFSCIIGYLAFYSDVYYPNYGNDWCPMDIFTDKGWYAVEKPSDQTSS